MHTETSTMLTGRNAEFPRENAQISGAKTRPLVTGKNVPLPSAKHAEDVAGVNWSNVQRTVDPYKSSEAEESRREGSLPKGARNEHGDWSNVQRNANLRSEGTRERDVFDDWSKVQRNTACEQGDGDEMEGFVAKGTPLPAGRGAGADIRCVLPRECHGSCPCVCACICACVCMCICVCICMC